jgi:hypothetical protein
MRNGSSAVTVWPAGTRTRAKLLSSLTGRSPLTPAALGGGFTNSIAISSPSLDEVLVMSTEILKTASLPTVWHETTRFE